MLCGLCQQQQINNKPAQPSHLFGSSDYDIAIDLNSLYKWHGFLKSFILLYKLWCSIFYLVCLTWFILWTIFGSRVHSNIHTYMRHLCWILWFSISQQYRISPWRHNQRFICYPILTVLRPWFASACPWLLLAALCNCRYVSLTILRLLLFNTVSFEQIHVWWEMHGFLCLFCCLFVRFECAHTNYLVPVSIILFVHTRVVFVEFCDFQAHSTQNLSIKTQQKIHLFPNFGCPRTSICFRFSIIGHCCPVQL